MNWLSNVLGAEWVAGFISGVAATILGFLLTILWDIYKMQRESAERDNAIMKAIGEELLSNKKSCERNLAFINAELSVLNERKSIVSPLTIMKTGFWDIAKINFPKILFHGNRLANLRNIASLIEQANEEIRSRENYRIYNGAMSNYTNKMQSYDENIFEALQVLAGEIAAFGEEINDKSHGSFLSHLFRSQKSKNKETQSIGTDHSNVVRCKEK
jgi:hypothetical protein